MPGGGMSRFRFDSRISKNKKLFATKFIVKFSEIVQKSSPPHGYFDEQIVPGGGEFDKKNSKCQMPVDLPALRGVVETNDWCIRPHIIFKSFPIYTSEVLFFRRVNIRGPHKK